MMKAEVETEMALSGPPEEEQVEALLRHIAKWAESRADIRGLALVGSHARGNAAATSDLDLILLTTSPKEYVERDAWIEQLGIGALIGTRIWGAITERRLRTPADLEVDIGIGQPAWASITPIDPGTAGVVTDGMRVIHDPDGLLSELLQSLH